MGLAPPNSFWAYLQLRKNYGERGEATRLHFYAGSWTYLPVVLGDDWRGRDEETEYPERLARNLLIEFVGGEPAAQLRDQFV